MTESESTSQFPEYYDEGGTESSARLDLLECERENPAVQNEIERNSGERATNSTRQFDIDIRECGMTN